MHSRSVRLGAVVIALATPLTAGGAQDDAGAESPALAVNADARAMLGVTVSISGTDRDTLGMLVTSVVPDGPADRVRIARGNRIAEIEGVSLRLRAVEVGQRRAAEAVQRRLARLLRAAQPGDDLELRIFGGGRYRRTSVQVANGERAAARSRPERGMEEGGVAIVDEAQPPTTLGGIADQLDDVQGRLRRLARAEPSDAWRDSLDQARESIAAAQRLVRAAEADRWRREAEREEGGGVDAADVLPGLRVAPVGEDLVPYFGAGSEGGLLVLEADRSWDPIRAGDVILRIDDAPAGVAALREALETQRSTVVELLRRRRTVIATLNERE